MNRRVKLFWVFLACAILLGGLEWQTLFRTGAGAPTWDSSASQKRQALRFALYPVLFEYGIRVDWVSGDSLRKRVRVPADLALDPIYASLVARFEELGGELLRGQSNPDGDRKLIEVGLDGRPALQVTLRSDNNISRPGGKIAIVIDASATAPTKKLTDFLAGDKPVTLSILPGMKYSSETRETAIRSGAPFLLNLPLDATNGQYGDGEFRLEPGMPENQIRKRVRTALAALPRAVGVKSQAGAGKRISGALLPPLMSELKRSGLFFFDGMGSAQSQAVDVARSYEVAVVRCNLTLDETSDAPSIRRQLHRLGEIAARNGSAVGIGNAQAVTLRTLAEEMPKMERLGFKFVLLPELAQ